MSTPAPYDATAPLSLDADIEFEEEDPEGPLPEAFTSRMLESEKTRLSAEVEVAVGKEGGTVVIPLSDVYANQAGPFFVSGVTIRGAPESGRKMSLLNGDTSSSLLKSHKIFTTKGPSETSAFDLGGIRADEDTLLLSKRLGKYATLSLSDVTSDARFVSVHNKAQGITEEMVSVPKEGSGRFIMHALEQPHNGRSPIYEPGSLAMNTDKNDDERFLVSKDDYNMAVGAFRDAKKRDSIDAFSSLALKVDPGAGAITLHVGIEALTQEDDAGTSFLVQAVEEDDL